MAATPRVEALVKPELLRWGRETAGLTVEAAAKKIDTTPERLLSWENGAKSLAPGSGVFLVWTTRPRRPGGTTGKPSVSGAPPWRIGVSLSSLPEGFSLPRCMDSPSVNGLFRSLR